VKKEESIREKNLPKLERRQWSGGEFAEEDPISPGNGQGEEEDRQRRG
jgi:hypothetical protein